MRIALALLYLVFLPLGCKTPEVSSPERPNIILIMADDMGYSDIGSYGGEIRTPNIDGLAENGLRFTDFYNNARCCPTRASLLTGLYPHQTGIGDMLRDWELPGYRGDLNESCVTIAQVLRQAGYSTYASGKWHVTRHMSDDGSKHNWPLQRGFERYFGTTTGAGSFFEPMTLTLDNEWIEVPEDFYYTDEISDHAVEFLREHDKKHEERPFFLYVAYTAPHWPLHALEEDIARYRGRYDTGWDSLRLERYKRMIDMGLIDSKWGLTDRDPRVPPWKETENKAWHARRMEVYAAQIDRMDQGIGRILSQLEQFDLMDNTLIVFLADNGGCSEEITDSWLDYLLHGGEFVARERTLDGRPMQIGNDPAVMPGPRQTYQSYGIGWANASNTPFRQYKSRIHQGGVASPLIVHWPERLSDRGALRHQRGHIMDIMATFADVAGADYPEEYDGHVITPTEGQSLLPAFFNETDVRGALFFEHEHNRAVLWGRWKLVTLGKDGPWELYDLQSDKTEMNDLAPVHPERVKEMSEMWEAWAVRAKVLPREKHKEELSR